MLNKLPVLTFGQVRINPTLNNNKSLACNIGLQDHKGDLPDYKFYNSNNYVSFKGHALEPQEIIWALQDKYLKAGANFLFNTTDLMRKGDYKEVLKVAKENILNLNKQKRELYFNEYDKLDMEAESASDSYFRNFVEQDLTKVNDKFSEFENTKHYHAFDPLKEVLEKVKSSSKKEEGNSLSKREIEILEKGIKSAYKDTVQNLLNLRVWDVKPDIKPGNDIRGIRLPNDWRDQPVIIDLHGLNLEGLKFSKEKEYTSIGDEDVIIDFTNANLKNSNFDKVDFRNCVFNGADLEGSTFTEPCINNVDFSNANLLNVKFIKPHIGDEGYTRFNNANLRDCEFNCLEKPDNNFYKRNPDIQDTSFNGATSGAIFRDAATYNCENLYEYAKKNNIECMVYRDPSAIILNPVRKNWD